MSETFKLPASSYEELIKIIKAYASSKNGQAMSLDDLAQSSGMITTIISKNNGFLVELELISSGKSKTPTDTCIQLGRAYSHEILDDAIAIWREIIENNEFLNKMISALRIRGGMDRANFVNHIIYSSGMDSTKSSKAGAGAIIEILKFANYAEDKDGKILATSQVKISSTSNDAVRCEPTSSIGGKTVQTNEIAKPIYSKNLNGCQIVLNLNISGEINDLDGLAEKVNDFIKKLSE